MNKLAVALGKAWAWSKYHAWAIGLFILGIVLVAVALFLKDQAWAMLLDWLGQLRDRQTQRAEELRAKANGLDAQRAKLLHEATQLAQERARREGRELDLARESAAIEEEIQGMDAAEVAEAFNRLGKGAQ